MQRWSVTVDMTVLVNATLWRYTVHDLRSHTWLPCIWSWSECGAGAETECVYPPMPPKSQWQSCLPTTGLCPHPATVPVELLSPRCSYPHLSAPGDGAEAVGTESCTRAGPEPSAPLLEPQRQREQSGDPRLQGYSSQFGPLYPPTPTYPSSAPCYAPENSNRKVLHRFPSLLEGWQPMG